jgi:hypothetical protein
MTFEIVFSAIGMNAPGLASTAPAPMTVTAGDDATRFMRSIIDAVVLGSTGRRMRLPAKRKIATARTTSRTATQVFGVDLDDEAASPITKAAATPTAMVAVKAPRKNQKPVRRGRSPSTSASTQNVTVVGDTIAASETRTSSEVLPAPTGEVS